MNIFSLTRGSKAVRDSIESISEQLRQDILRNERNFTATGGLFSTLQFLRKSEQFTLLYDGNAQNAKQLKRDLPGNENIDTNTLRLEREVFGFNEPFIT